MGETSGWNLWVWLPCIGVVSGCCCKDVYIDILTIIITFPYSIRRRIRNRNGDFTSRGGHVNCAIMAMLYTHSIGNQL